jgi:general stress protein 26
MSTVSLNGWPHIVPVSYVYLLGQFYVPTNPRTAKVRNLARSKKATIVVDDELQEHGVMIECSSTILRGVKAQPLTDRMRRVKRWQMSDSTVVIQLTPRRKVSWFLK